MMQNINCVSFEGTVSHLGDAEARVVIAIPWQSHYELLGINLQVQILIVSLKER